MKGYSELARFHHLDPVEACVAVLEEYNIPHRLATDALTPDVSALGQSIEPACMVMVPNERYVEARNSLLETARLDAADAQGEELEPYLSWETDDLQNMLREVESWGPTDLALAEKVLRERGAAVPDIHFQAPMDEKAAGTVSFIQADPPIAEGRKRGQPTVIAMGFILGSLGPTGLFHIFGALWGVIIGGSLAFTVTRMPDGTRAYIYDRRSRYWGGAILIYSVVATLGWILASRYLHGR